MSRKATFGWWLGAVLALFAVAAIEDGGASGVRSGMVTRIDASARRLAALPTTQDGSPLADEEQVFYWTEATRVQGPALQEGQLIHFTTVEQEGRPCATWIHVGSLQRGSR